MTTFGCWTCSLPCCVSGGWFFSSGGHYFANIDASLYNSSDVSLLLAENDALGDGLQRAWISLRAAFGATRLAYFFRILPLCGKNLIVCIIRSALVLLN